ncbi:hypothetical protein CHS0354_026674 [Potamilus streckersoni]|uniref:Uncharacterized protein n=1 Tax=Potamilus streckersoni TaxID=2493646 RepID=A0AAE0S7R4_9BIVA|nr:hypothetical protein CHS0354_026674 [Potamilus streckersoni]
MAEPSEVDPLHAEKKNILRWEKIVHFQLFTIIRIFPFQEGEKKMSQSTEMPFQASEKIRADSGQEVPLQPREKISSTLQQMFTIFRKCSFHMGLKKMGQSSEMPFQAGENIRAYSGLEVPLKPR